jgi:putative glutamine amidotransferase
MKMIAVTQRVAKEPAYLAGHDMLDANLSRFLLACDCLPIIIPNVLEVAQIMLKKIHLDGVLLSGGNVTTARTEVENYLIEQAVLKQWPLLGVCQGMQRIQQFLGVNLRPVTGHVEPKQSIQINKKSYTTNSYHEFGTTTTHSDLMIFAQHADGVIKGVKHKLHSIYGIMWHPEREKNFSKNDIAFVKSLYAGEKECEQLY